MKVLQTLRESTLIARQQETRFVMKILLFCRGRGGKIERSSPWLYATGFSFTADSQAGGEKTLLLAWRRGHQGTSGPCDYHGGFLLKVAERVLKRTEQKCGRKRNLEPWEESRGREE